MGMYEGRTAPSASDSEFVVGIGAWAIRKAAAYCFLHRTMFDQETSTVSTDRSTTTSTRFSSSELSLWPTWKISTGMAALILSPSFPSGTKDFGFIVISF